MTVPISADKKAEILALAGTGLGRNAIARQAGVSTMTVGRYCSEAGITFDWGSTEIAVRARRVQIAQMQQELAMAALLRAGEALDEMDAPTDIVQFSAGSETRTPQFYTHTLDGPTFADKRQAATTFGILVQRAAELLRSNPGAPAAGAKSILEGLGDALRIAADALPADQDPTIEPVNQSREQMIANLEAEADEESAAETDPDA